MRGAMVERGDELARLLAVIAAIDERGGAVALVHGEAGIGKSTLVAHLADELGDRAEVLRGGSDDLSTPQPLGPLRDIARSRPELLEALAADDRSAVMHALLDLLSRPWQPTVVVLEDVHWADDATLDVITFLGRRITSAHGVLVLTYRDNEVADGHPLHRVIGDLPPSAVVHVPLAALSVAGIDELAGDGDVDATAVHALTRGNPLFVAEVLASDDELPASVRDAVLARATRLTPDSLELVRIASIVPGRTSWSLAERLSGSTVEAVQDAVRLGLLTTDDDGIVFRHELQRRAVESTLPDSERRRLHALVLAALDDEADQDDPARRAHHAARAGDVAALLEHAHRAGRAASAVASHRQALAHYRSMAPHLDRLPAPVAADVLDEWSRTASHLGDPESADIVARAVAARRALDEPLALQRTLTFGAFVLEVAGHRERSVAWAEEAVGIAEQADDREALADALNELARLRETRGELREARAANDRALAIGTERGDDRILATAMIRDAMIRATADPDAALHTFAAARTRARAVGFAYADADSLVLAGVTRLRMLVDLAVGIDEVDEGSAIAAAHELDGLAKFGHAVLSALCLLRSDWTRADELARRVLAAPAPHAQVVAAHTVAALAVRRGDQDAAQLLAQACDEAARVGHPYALQAAAATAAEHVWTTDGDPADWQDVLDRGRASLASTDPWYRDELAHWLDTIGMSVDGYEPSTAGFRALASGRHTAAADVFEDEHMPYHRALALLRGADDQLVEAVSVLDDLGAEATANRARAIVRARGLTPPRPRSRAARANPAGLTGRQMEVLILLATGATNTRIAESLFISRRTVENHVAAILRALDATDRGAAVERAAAMGLLDG